MTYDWRTEYIFQVYTSANYLLSDLFVPDSSLNDDWSPTDSGENSDDDNLQVGHWSHL